MAFYRHKHTGKVQMHPKSGIGDSLNSVEIDESGHAVGKPRTSLAPSKAEIKAARDLLKDHSASPIEQAAAKVVIEAGKPPKKPRATATPKTTGTPAVDSKQEGA